MMIVMLSTVSHFSVRGQQRMSPLNLVGVPTKFSAVHEVLAAHGIYHIFKQCRTRLLRIAVLLRLLGSNPQRYRVCAMASAWESKQPSAA